MIRETDDRTNLQNKPDTNTETLSSYSRKWCMGDLNVLG